METKCDKLIPYHMLTHDMITAFYDRMSQVTSPEVSKLFMETTAAIVAKNIVKDAPNPVTEMKRVLEQWGVQLHSVKIGSRSEWNMDCPFATQVHPQLQKEHTVCPAALLMVGASRLQERNSTLVDYHLTDNGSKFTIERGN